ncbi:peptidoglycan-binding domain-containing protein, partial [Ancylobacter sonchi]
LPPVKPAVPKPVAKVETPAPAAQASAPAAAPAAAAAPVRPPAEVAVSARMIEVQKALARLGYGPIRIDGRASDATEKAIKDFERDRRLPVTGQLSDRLVKELNAVAGFSIQ